MGGKIFFWLFETGFLCAPLAFLEISIDQLASNSELRDSPASAPQVLGLKTCTTTTLLTEKNLNYINFIYVG